RTERRFERGPVHARGAAARRVPERDPLQRREIEIAPLFVTPRGESARLERREPFPPELGQPVRFRALRERAEPFGERRRRRLDPGHFATAVSSIQEYPRSSSSSASSLLPLRTMRPL